VFLQKQGAIDVRVIGLLFFVIYFSLSHDDLKICFTGEEEARRRPPNLACKTRKRIPMVCSPFDLQTIIDDVTTLN